MATILFGAVVTLAEWFELRPSVSPLTSCLSQDGNSTPTTAHIAVPGPLHDSGHRSTKGCTARLQRQCRTRSGDPPPRLHIMRCFTSDCKCYWFCGSSESELSQTNHSLVPASAFPMAYVALYRASLRHPWRE
ncbi:hypothetical protein C8Q73DRAFT_1382 [Cubamyces lactineus]|nr:hypothetical protein C8Q73DRAFT_1382 [Cubamyces lactineus]